MSKYIRLGQRKNRKIDNKTTNASQVDNREPHRYCTTGIPTHKTNLAAKRLQKKKKKSQLKPVQQLHQRDREKENFFLVTLLKCPSALRREPVNAAEKEKIYIKKNRDMGVICRSIVEFRAPPNQIEMFLQRRCFMECQKKQKLSRLPKAVQK